MGTDKSELVFHEGKNQKQYACSLLEKVCDRVFLSVSSSDNISENMIVDAFGNVGPLGAIASAQQAHPDQAWLVLACDLPLLKESHLRELCKTHKPSVEVTYYLSAINDFPEPLCSIWEPSTEAAILQAIESENYCAQNFLKNTKGQALPSPGLWVLANANSPEDILEIKARISGGNTPKNVNVSYYAQLREITGTSEETFTTDSTTLAGVFEELRAKYKMRLKRGNMMVARNDSFSKWNDPVKEGDEIVFMPPFAGG